MTTIAWDGTTLAADTQGFAGGLSRKVPKIFRLKDGRLFGGSGEYQEALLVRDWLNGDTQKPDKLEDFTGLIIDKGECSRLESKLIHLPIGERFHAVGSGRDYAITAMHLGKSAREAVEITRLFDVYTGGEVETLTETRPVAMSIVDSTILNAAFNKPSHGGTKTG